MDSIRIYNCDGCSNQYFTPDKLTKVEVIRWETVYFMSKTRADWNAIEQQYCPECLSRVEPNEA